jgi:hypothetical protein
MRGIHPVDQCLLGVGRGSYRGMQVQKVQMFRADGHCRYLHSLRISSLVVGNEKTSGSVEMRDERLRRVKRMNTGMARIISCTANLSVEEDVPSSCSRQPSHREQLCDIRITAK